MFLIRLKRYRRIVTHGFVLDERGRKMAKSLGNVVEPRAVIENGNGTIFIICIYKSFVDQ